MTVALLTILAAAALAFANGGNDVSKGVATLAGSGRATFRHAIAWGTLWTAVGAVAALGISMGLVTAFTSALVGPELIASPVFPLAAATGAAAWVLLASATGLPVSTTHALTGAIVGVALVAGGVASIAWWLLLSAIAAPLALSPFVSAGMAYGAHAAASRLSPGCVCVASDLTAVSVDGSGAITAAPATRVVASREGCEASTGTWRILSADTLHWGAAAALSFARGANDNPKIAAIGALGFAAVGVNLGLAFAATAVAMVAGSYLAGLRVTKTLGERVVHMDGDTGLSSALVAAGLALTASVYALPVSTTHVSTGAIVGAGLRKGRGVVVWSTVGSFVLAWMVTLPIAAAFGALIAWTLSALM